MLSTATDHPAFDPRIEALLERGRSEHAAERLPDAIDTFAEAERLAEELGDGRATDRAFLNRCTSTLKLERSLGPAAIQRLREILMAGEDVMNCFLGAYDLARAYECFKEHRKGLFYARIALDRSQILGADEYLAPSHNQIGNFLLAESRFREACAEYEKALDLLPRELSVPRALILTNLGYAQVVLEQYDGLALIYRSLRMLRSLGARRERIFPHLDLCFALIEVGRCRHALRHGARALALAEDAGEQESIQQALFLLGEAAHQDGDPATARTTFQQLQQRYFPDNPGLADVLLTVDIRKLVNLKA